MNDLRFICRSIEVHFVDHYFEVHFVDDLIEVMWFLLHKSGLFHCFFYVSYKIVMIFFLGDYRSKL